MGNYAFLCGSAPDGWRQKKLADMQEFLWGDREADFPHRNVCVFPNGVSELVLECALNAVLCEAWSDGAAGEVLVYLCLMDPEMGGVAAGGGMDAADAFLWRGGSVFLGPHELRRDVLEHYADEAGKAGLSFRVVCVRDGSLVREEDADGERQKW